MLRLLLVAAVCTLLRWNFVACRYAPTVTDFFKFSSSVDIRNIFTNRDISSSADGIYLICRARGRYPLIFTFYRNGQKIETRTARRFRQRTQILKISKKGQSLSGTFKCMVNNKSGRDSKMLILGHSLNMNQRHYVRPKAATVPEITRVRALRYKSQLRNKSRIFIICEATGTFPLNFTWYKGNTTIKTESQRHTGSSSVMATTEGMYGCQVTNIRGKDAKEITVIYNDYNWTRQCRGKTIVTKSPNSQHKYDLRLKYFPFIAVTSGVLFVAVVCLIIAVVCLHRKIKKMSSEVKPENQSSRADCITALQDTHKGGKQLSVSGLLELGFKDASSGQADVKKTCKEMPGRTSAVLLSSHDGLCNKMVVKSDSNVAMDTTYDYAYQDTFFLSPETIAAIKSERSGSLQISSSRESDSPKDYNYAYDHTARHS